MSIKKVTFWVTVALIPALVVAILIYDAVAIKIGGTEASISDLIIKSSYAMPFMTFLIGKVTGWFEGHLFWRMRANQDTLSTGIDKVPKP